MIKSVLLLFVLSGAAFCADDLVSGTWKLDNDVAGTSWSETCELKLDATKVTGKCTIEDKTVEVKGDVDGQKIVFQHAGEYNGDALTLTFTGTLDADGGLKGSIDVQPLAASGDFTAKKDK